MRKKRLSRWSGLQVFLLMALLFVFNTDAQAWRERNEQVVQEYEGNIKRKECFLIDGFPYDPEEDGCLFYAKISRNITLNPASSPFRKSAVLSCSYYRSEEHVAQSEVPANGWTELPGFNQNRTLSMQGILEFFPEQDRWGYFIVRIRDQGNKVVYFTMLSQKVLRFHVNKYVYYMNNLFEFDDEWMANRYSFVRTTVEMLPNDALSRAGIRYQFGFDNEQERILWGPSQIGAVTAEMIRINTPYINFSELLIGWTTPGQKTVTVWIGGKGYTQTIEARLNPEDNGTPMVLAVNNNNSDGNAPTSSDRLRSELDQDDPDIQPLRFTLPMPGGQSIMLGSEASRPILQDWINSGTVLELRRSQGVCVYTSRSKGTMHRVLYSAPDDFDPAPFGNGYYIYNLAGKDIEEVLWVFNNLFVEGIVQSQTLNNDWIALTANTGQHERYSQLQKITCVQIRLNHAPLMSDFFGDEALKKIDRLPDIHNPAVIPILEGNATPQNAALFRVNTGFGDLVQWSVEPLANQSRPVWNQAQNQLGESGVPGGSANFFQGTNTGKQVQLHGNTYGFVKIGLRVAGAGTDYLQFICLVDKKLKIPLGIHHIYQGAHTSGGDIDTIRQIVTEANRLLIQAGVQIVPVNNAQAYDTEYPHCRAEIFAKDTTTRYSPGAKTLYLRSMPFADPKRYYFMGQAFDAGFDVIQPLYASKFREREGNPVTYALDLSHKTDKPIRLPATLSPSITPPGQAMPQFQRQAETVTVTNIIPWIGGDNKGGHLYARLLSNFKNALNIYIVEKIKPDSSGQTFQATTNALNLLDQDPQNKSILALFENGEKRQVTLSETNTSKLRFDTHTPEGQARTVNFTAFFASRRHLREGRINYLAWELAHKIVEQWGIKAVTLHLGNGMLPVSDPLSWGGATRLGAPNYRDMKGIDITLPEALVLRQSILCQE